MPASLNEVGESGTHIFFSSFIALLKQSRFGRWLGFAPRSLQVSELGMSWRARCRCETDQVTKANMWAFWLQCLAIKRRWVSGGYFSVAGDFCINAWAEMNVSDTWGLMGLRKQGQPKTRNSSVQQNDFWNNQIPHGAWLGCSCFVLVFWGGGF